MFALVRLLPFSVESCQTARGKENKHEEDEGRRTNQWLTGRLRLALFYFLILSRTLML